MAGSRTTTIFEANQYMTVSYCQQAALSFFRPRRHRRRRRRLKYNVRCKISSSAVFRKRYAESVVVSIVFAKRKRILSMGPNPSRVFP